MKGKFRTIFWAAAAVLVAVLLTLAFRPQPVAVDLAEATRGPMRVLVRAEGRTRVRNEYIVSAPVGGQLLRIEHKPGAHVEAGQVLARILPSDPTLLDTRSRAELAAAVRSAEAALDLARTETERAQAQHGFAQAEAARIQTLRSDDLTSVEALDRARLQLRVAEANLATARSNSRVREAELEAARARLIEPGGVSEASVVTVTAPTSGRVMRVAQESRTVVAGGTEILMLGDPRDLEVVGEFLSTDAVQIEPGAVALIENWGRDRAPLRGRVRLVEPYGFLKISALGVEEQRVNVIVDFLASAEEWASLAHGYRVEAAVVTWEGDDVVQVPVAALFRNDGGWAVYRVEDGEARLTPVEVGHDNGRDAEITGGLEAGQTIVLYPGEQLADGIGVVDRDG